MCSIYTLLRRPILWILFLMGSYLSILQTWWDGTWVSNYPCVDYIKPMPVLFPWDGVPVALPQEVEEPDLESGRKVEMVAQCRECHTGGIGFSVGGVTCDMRGSYIYKVEKFLIDIRFIFPSIDNSISDNTIFLRLEVRPYCPRRLPGLYW
mgnify:CR=1 FL=1